MSVTPTTTALPVHYIAVDFLPAGSPAAVTVADTVHVYVSRGHSIDDIVGCLNVLHADLAEQGAFR